MTDATRRPAARAETDAHERLAQHLALLGMGFPPRDELLELLRTHFSETEAEAAMLLPTGVGPFEVVSAASAAERAAAAGSSPPVAAASGGDVPGTGCSATAAARSAAPVPPGADGLTQIYEGLVARGLLFAGRTPAGERGYALHQVGYGFPQSFFWDGGGHPEALAMAEFVSKYFNREVTRESYGGTATKPYRYVPIDKSLDEGLQAVLPVHAMEPILAHAETFALAHCPCRVGMRLRGRPCEHPEDVCMKFDELAEYLIERGLGRRIDRDEAREVVRRAAAAGLVHFVDNAEGHAKHNCNCCGCACWNVGAIRRRKIARDVLMATYFLRTTETEKCTGCGRCVEVCPVQAITLEPASPAGRRRKAEAKVASVDTEWCIGCGLCVGRCRTGAAGLAPRRDVSLELAPDFATLHRRILEDRGLDRG